MNAGRDLTKLAGILGRLASDHDGERAAAGLLATRFMEQRNWTWRDVLHPPALPPPDRPRRATAGTDARIDLALCARHFDRLNPWESEFVVSLSKRHHPLTPGQARKVSEIAGRLRLAGCT